MNPQFLCKLTYKPAGTGRFWIDHRWMSMPRMFYELSEKNDIFLQVTFLRDTLYFCLHWSCRDLTFSLVLVSFTSFQCRVLTYWGFLLFKCGVMMYVERSGTTVVVNVDIFKVATVMKTFFTQSFSSTFLLLLQTRNQKKSDCCWSQVCKTAPPRVKLP